MLLTDCRRVLTSRHYINGTEVACFEEEFASYLGVSGCVGTACGTDALYLALLALGVGPEDEVITVSLTAYPTLLAILRTGAVAVLVDVDDTLTMDPDALIEGITSHTKAIVPVHLYGSPCDMQRICDIAEAHGLIVIEDACQAHGAAIEGRRVGTFGHAAAFSFYPTKNLGAIGDGGMVASSDPQILQRLYRLRSMQSENIDGRQITGYNSRLDELQAAILRSRLKELEKRNLARRKAAAAYNALLPDCLKRPFAPAQALSAVHIYAVRSEQRPAFISTLERGRVPAMIHYPKLAHEYGEGNIRCRDLRISIRVREEILSLPMHPNLQQSSIEYICTLLTEELSHEAP
ncbi:MAG: DegT/DnrJ/EryC1/StrS family aminotransferase [bacterium]|nr:DegT/DnrJ/EryC1/StrS family aminotransferase [bacterium]